MTLLHVIGAAVLALVVAIGIEEWRIAGLRADLAEASADNATLTANWNTCKVENGRADGEVARAAAAATACAALQGLTIQSGADAVARSRAEAARLRDALATERTVRDALYGEDADCAAMERTLVCAPIERRLRDARQAH